MAEQSAANSGHSRYQQNTKKLHSGATSEVARRTTKNSQTGHDFIIRKDSARNRKKHNSNTAHYKNISLVAQTYNVGNGGANSVKGVKA